MKKALNIDVHSLEGISFRGQPVAPLSLARYYSKNKVLYYNGAQGEKPGHVGNEGDYTIRTVDITTEEGRKEFDEKFELLPAGLRERVFDALFEAGYKDPDTPLYKMLNTYDEDLKGLSAEHKSQVMFAVENVSLRKEVEQL